MKKAWVVLIVTIIFSLVAGFFRRQALLFGFTADGLTDSTFYAHKLVAIISIVFLCLALATVLSQRVLKGGKANVYLSSGAPAFAIELVAAALVILGGVLFLMQTKFDLSFATVMGVLAVLGGLCMLLFVIKTSQRHPKSGGVGILFTTLFAAFWLICTFKLNGANPAIAAFAYKILGVISACLACYFTAGMCVGHPKPRPAAFFHMAALYFLIISLLTPYSAGDFFITVGFILFTACRGVCIIGNAFWAVE